MSPVYAIGAERRFRLRKGLRDATITSALVAATPMLPWSREIFGIRAEFEIAKGDPYRIRLTLDPLASYEDLPEAKRSFLVAAYGTLRYEVFARTAVDELLEGLRAARVAPRADLRARLEMIPQRDALDLS